MAIVAGIVAVGALVIATAGAAAPALAIASGGVIGGMSAGTITTFTSIAYISGAVAVNSAAVAGTIYFSSSKTNDPYARPGQKKQGRERKEKKKNDNWKQNPNKKAKPLPKHTPGRDHRKYIER